MDLPDLPEASRSRVAQLFGRVLRAYVAAINMTVTTVIHVAR